jgi:hypothetical protein
MTAVSETQSLMLKNPLDLTLNLPDYFILYTLGEVVPVSLASYSQQRRGTTASPFCYG